MSSSYRLELDKWLSTVEVNAELVFDIGGSQLPVKNRVLSWQVSDYRILDLSTPHVDSPKPDIECDLNKFNKNLHDYRGMVNAIFCLEVFEYIYDPMMAFNTIHNLLHKDGIAYISFPFLYPHHQPIEDDSLRYAEGGVRRLAAAAGMKIKELIPRRPESYGAEGFWSMERMKAAKGYDHHVIGWIGVFTK